MEGKEEGISSVWVFHEKIIFFLFALLFLSIALNIIMAVSIIMSMLDVHTPFDVDFSSIDSSQSKIPRNLSVPLYMVGLNESEEKKALLLYNRLKEIYLQEQINITFDKNITKYSIYKRSDNLKGFNKRGSGEIYVKYKKDINSMARTLCHELLHTHLYLDKIRHKIVYDLADNYYPCYKTNVFNNNNY